MKTPESGYPQLPDPVSLLVVADQLGTAITLGMLLVELPNDHPLVVAASLALELRERMRDELETTRAMQPLLVGSSRRFLANRQMWEARRAAA